MDTAWGFVRRVQRLDKDIFAENLHDLIFTLHPARGLNLYPFHIRAASSRVGLKVSVRFTMPMIFMAWIVPV